MRQLAVAAIAERVVEPAVQPLPEGEQQLAQPLPTHGERSGQPKHTDLSQGGWVTFVFWDLFFSGKVAFLFRVAHTNTHTHTRTHTQEDQCEWHRMTRMTGPDCVVMCNLINTHTHTSLPFYSRHFLFQHLRDTVSPNSLIIDLYIHFSPLDVRGTLVNILSFILSVISRLMNSSLSGGFLKRPWTCTSNIRFLPCPEEHLTQRHRAIAHTWGKKK